MFALVSSLVSFQAVPSIGSRRGQLSHVRIALWFGACVLFHASSVLLSARFFLFQRNALHAVAQRFLSDFEIVADKKTHEALIEHICGVHEGVNLQTNTYFDKYRRRTYVTPKSYLSFIDNYKKV